MVSVADVIVVVTSAVATTLVVASVEAASLVIVASPEAAASAVIASVLLVAAASWSVGQPTGEERLQPLVPSLQSPYNH